MTKHQEKTLFNGFNREEELAALTIELGSIEHAISQEQSPIDRSLLQYQRNRLVRIIRSWINPGD